MVFTSPIFLLYFLPLTLAVYYATPARWRNLLLALVSYVFYGWWSPWYVLLMLVSTAIDWFCGLAIARPGAPDRARRRAVAISIVANLSLLGFFKYFMFAAENVDRMVRALGGGGFEVLQVVLPVGISFYSFQSMSYSIDLYRGQAERAPRFIDFACYVSMFPQLIAGPIVRYKEVARQLVRRPGRGELFGSGVLFFVIGFAKKVLLANPLGEVADVTFGASALAVDTAWFGLAAYAFQIYFDFSGYSDMAIGLGRMFGFELPTNFLSPYRSQSITEFWRRWHVSLSSWLRDYLYVPLGGNRRGLGRTYVNLSLTMLLGGLWHGAAWTFVVWGAIHGTLLGLERVLGKRAPWTGLPAPLRTLVTFALVNVAWVFFRARDLPTALTYVAALVAPTGEPAAAALVAARCYEPYLLATFAAAIACTWLGRETRELVERALARPIASAGWTLAFAACVVVMFLQTENPFLYFQF